LRLRYSFDEREPWGVIGVRLPLSLARLSSVIALFALLAAFYLLVIRPSELHWGATAAEIARPMPGDALVLHPTFCATRALTISGRPEDIWPWILQMGYGRAGFYGYDLIENIGSKRGIRSAEHIVPELQHPVVGDRIYMSRIAYLVFDSIVPDQYLIWRADTARPDGAFTWALYSVDTDHTRLISRIRLRYHWTDRRALLDLFTEFADPVAVPKILVGVKDRVEGRMPQSLMVQAIEIVVWIFALFELIVALVSVFQWRSWWQAWLLALASACLLLFALYAREPVLFGASAVLILAVLLWRCQRRARIERQQPVVVTGSSSGLNDPVRVTSEHSDSSHDGWKKA
jgi:hypothetical protein